MTLRNSTRRRLLRGSLYPSTGVTVADVVLLVDSGADVTLLPRQAVERLGIGLATGRGYEISGFDGTKSFVPPVNLDMHEYGRAAAEAAKMMKWVDPSIELAACGSSG